MNKPMFRRENFEECFFDEHSARLGSDTFVLELMGQRGNVRSYRVRGGDVVDIRCGQDDVAKCLKETFGHRGYVSSFDEVAEALVRLDTHAGDGVFGFWIENGILKAALDCHDEYGKRCSVATVSTCFETAVISCLLSWRDGYDLRFMSKLLSKLGPLDPLFDGYESLS